MKELRSRSANISFRGFGLQKMLQEGLKESGAESVQQSAMWLYNLLDIANFKRKLSIVKDDFHSNPPDLVILVDYGGFNLFIAKQAHMAGIPVLYYILPQAWAHGRYRLKKIRKWVTKAAVIYPFEPKICAAYGVDADFVGHPLFDSLHSNPPRKEKIDTLEENYGDNLIAVFPGSRGQEVRANLPIILDACHMLKKQWPGLNFLAACPEHVKTEASNIINNHSFKIELSKLRPVELSKAAKVCITKSGTITLEIASQLTPMVILYRINGFLYFLISGMTHTPFAGIVNSLSGEMVCPEKVMWRADPHWLYRRVDELLSDDSLYQHCCEDLHKLIETIGETGASQKTADIAFEIMRNNG